MSCPGFRTLFQLCDAATPAPAGMRIPVMYQLHLLCRKTLVLSAKFGTKTKFDLSIFIQKLGESHLMFSFLLPPAPNCQNSKTIHYLK